MTITFTVYGSVVGKNESKGWNRKHGNFYVPQATKMWMRMIAGCACHVAAQASWPDPFLIREASYKVQRFNMRGDSDRGNTYLQDALQFTRWPTPKDSEPYPGPIGLVGDDNALWCDGSPPSITDPFGTRVEVSVTLRALRAPYEADDLRKRWYEREARRKIKRTVKRTEVRNVATNRRQRDELAEIERRTGMRLI